MVSKKSQSLAEWFLIYGWISLVAFIVLLVMFFVLSGKGGVNLGEAKEINIDCPQTNMKISLVDIPEGKKSCNYPMGWALLTPLNYSETKKYDFTLPYELHNKKDSCGLNQLVYYEPTGKYVIHIYDTEENLIGGYKADSCPKIEETFNNIIVMCDKETEEIIYKNLTRIKWVK